MLWFCVSYDIPFSERDTCLNVDNGQFSLGTSVSFFLYVCVTKRHFCLYWWDDILLLNITFAIKIDFSYLIFSFSICSFFPIVKSCMQVTSKRQLWKNVSTFVSHYKKKKKKYHIAKIHRHIQNFRMPFT